MVVCTDLASEKLAWHWEEFIQPRELIHTLKIVLHIVVVLSEQQQICGPSTRHSGLHKFYNHGDMLNKVHVWWDRGIKDAHGNLQFLQLRLLVTCDHNLDVLQNKIQHKLYTDF